MSADSFSGLGRMIEQIGKEKDKIEKDNENIECIAADQDPIHGPFAHNARDPCRAHRSSLQPRYLESSESIKTLTA